MGLGKKNGGCNRDTSTQTHAFQVVGQIMRDIIARGECEAGRISLVEVHGLGRARIEIGNLMCLRTES